MKLIICYGRKTKRFNPSNNNNKAGCMGSATNAINS